MAVTAVIVEVIVNERGMKDKKTKLKAAPRTPVQVGISTERLNSVVFGSLKARAVTGAERPRKRNGARAMLNIRVVSWSLGVFTALSFVLCVIYGLIMPPSLHMSAFLEMVLPAFKWLTLVGFCLGLIESFLWGVYAGLVFVPIYNFFLNAGLHKASVSANSQERGER